jgi:hypothetical protein
MMAPKHERQRVLAIAIDQASSILDAPIDRIVVSDSHITCWAGSRCVEMDYGYSNGYDRVGGSVLAGSGDWWVNPIGPPTGTWTRVLDRLKVRTGRIPEK